MERLLIKLTGKTDPDVNQRADNEYADSVRVFMWSLYTASYIIASAA